MRAGLLRFVPSASVRWGLLAACAWSAVGILLWHSSWLDRSRLFWLDQLFALRQSMGHAPAPHDAVMIVGVDDRSRKQMRQRLQAGSDDRMVLRALLAGLLDRLAKAGARVAAVDYLLDVPSREASDQAIVAAISGGEAGRGIDTVLGSLVTLLEKKRPIDAFRQWAVEGNLAVLPDADGKFRRSFTGYIVAETADGIGPLPGGRPLNREGQDLIPTFALQACRVFSGRPDDAGSRLASPWGEYHPDQSVDLPGCPRVPGTTLIDFVGPAQTFELLGRQVSAIDVVDGKVGADRLKDKLVLIGPAERFNDRFAVSVNPSGGDQEYREHLRRLYGPQFDALVGQGVEMVRSKAMAGIEIHANVASQILQGRYLRELSLDRPLLAQALIALPLLAGGWIFWRLPHSSSRSRIVLTVAAQAGLLLAVLAGAAGASLWLFSAHGWVFVPIELLLAWSLQAVCGTAWTSLQLRRRNRQIEQMFGSAVGDELLEYIRRNPQVLTCHRRHDATVLFADIRGFTPLTEALGADQVVLLLREHFEAMWQPLAQNGAWVDKYVGDLIMAAWNVVQPMDDHALRGLRAAVGMKRALADLNARRLAGALPPIDIGVGLHTGELVSGNVGSRKRHNFTIIGETVNIASRIEGQAKQGELLISAETYSRVREHVRAREWGTVTLKGTSRPVLLYEVLGLADGTDVPGAGKDART